MPNLPSISDQRAAAQREAARQQMAAEAERRRRVAEADADARAGGSNAAGAS